MKDLPRNYGAFLLSLGATPHAARVGLPCPAYHHDRTMPTPSAMVETPTEVAAHIDTFKSPAHRAFPHRGPGARVM